MVGSRTLLACERLVNVGGWPRAGQEGAGVELQGVAHIVQPDAVGQLTAAQADHVTPRTEGPALFSHTGVPRQLRNQMRRNIVAELPKNGELRIGWGFYVFQSLSCDRVNSGFQPRSLLSCGMAVDFGNRGCNPCLVFVFGRRRF